MKRERLFMKSMLLVFALVAFYQPMGAMAGSLEPSAAPAPTMRTLQEIYDKVDTVLAANRWAVVLNGDGVLDRKTGLIWAKAPESTMMNWNDAVSYCSSSLLGGKNDWRLPTIDELNILVDKNQSNPVLPLDNPFVGILPYTYWSSNPDANNASNAWSVRMGDGYVDSYAKSGHGYAWPVRGGQ